MANTATIRVLREIKELQAPGSDLSLAVAHREDDVRNVRALIIGPPETPYEFGFFEFKAKFGDQYPTHSPSVRCLTTNGGRCRFNPNIYASGKVCLSILGTWRGEKGEDWSTAQGLESVLISIQSLMSSNPYENEPGFEHTDLAGSEATNYAQKIRHETLRITVVQRLEQALQIADDDHASKSNAIITPPVEYDDDGDSDDSDGIKEYDPAKEKHDSTLETEFAPFDDLYKRRFLWYFDSYLKSIAEASKRVKDGTSFKTTPFEYGSNGLYGKYAYSKLEKRMRRIYQHLEAEVKSWAEEGKTALAREHGTAIGLQHQFTSLRAQYARNGGPSVELSLVDENPLVWNLTFFGPNETDLYGATINVRLNFPLAFPDEQPRVTVLTPLFHHRISASTKVLCYFPTKLHSVQSHIESIMAAIQDEEPAYDPRALVNPEASALLWGDENSKKLYRRKLRRSVQDAMDCMDEY